MVETDDFTIEDLGMQEQWVYDIEVDDNHNFFGNNILVHNSNYFTVAPFVKKAFKDKPNATKAEKADFCNNFYQQIVDKFVQKSIDDLGNELNAYNTDVIGSEREIIADCLSFSTSLKVQINNTSKTLSIGELAKMYGINELTKTEDFVGTANKNIMIESYGKNGLELKKILNIQKKVTIKKMVELISPDNKSTVLTEDHKIATVLDGKITYKEAKNITEDDILMINNKEQSTKGFKVKPCKDEGERKIVYDIEVADNHNFYADGILVHNCGVWTAKKKYFARVIDSEGVRYKEPKMKVMGLDIIRSGTPSFVKKKLKESLNIILDSDAESMIRWKDLVKEEFNLQNLSDIARVQGVSNIDYSVNDKGVPIGARAVLVHNEYVKKLGIENEIQLLEAGNKVKLAYLTEPNIFGSNVVAWNDDKFVDIIKNAKCFDYDLCFEKFFLSPLQLMTDALKWDILRETENLDDDW